MSKFSVKKPLTVFVAVLAVIILGVVAFTRMTPDLLPNMDFPYVMIMTTYPGQSPEIVEEEITRPLEQSMATLEHIKELTSTSQENYSLLVLEFEESVNMDTVGVDIQQEISALQGTWDDAVGTPYVLKINPSVLPIAIAAVSKDDMDITELSDFLDETIVPKLEGVTGVASVSTSGSIYRQVHVVISQEKIDDVNARMAESVDSRLADAKKELEDTKKELEDAQKELEDAQEELDSGKETLVGSTSSAQTQLSGQQMELIKGREEIQQRLAELQQTKATLASAVSQLEQAQASYEQLDGAVSQLTDGIAKIDELTAGLAEAKSQRETLVGQIAQLEQQIAALSAMLPTGPAGGTDAPQEPGTELPPADTQPPAEDVQPPAEDTQPPAEDTQPPAGDAQPQAEDAQPAEGEIPPEAAPPEASMTAETKNAPDIQDPAAQLAQMQAQLAAAQGALAALDAQIAVLEPQAATADAQRETLQTQLTTAQNGIAALDSQLAAQGLDRAGLPAKIKELKANQQQVDDGIGQLNDTLEQLDSGAIQLSQAMGALTSGQSEGLLQLADAAAQITINSASVQSGLEQVDSGLEQLEDSRADALEQADISGSITMETVAQILGAQNFAMPAGYIQQEGISYMVSVGDELTDLDELKGLLLFDTGEDAIGPVYLEDVADVFITDNSDSVYAKLNGSDGIMLTFDKQSNAATAEVSDALRARFDELEEQYPGLEFVFLMDQGDYIYLIVDSIMSSLLTGALFSILILFLFLRDLRPTVITLVAIPVSVIFAFVLMYFSGVTLNMISLSGLAVAVGMLVDNSIVVIENIYRLRSKGATAVQAAVAGARQVAGAITSSTLTTVCVFLPIVFVEGITRQLFTDLALTMTYALMASLVIALTLVPAMAKGMLRDTKRKKYGQSQKGEGAFYRGYRKIAMWNLRHKWVTLLLAIALLGATGWMALQKGFSFMPEIDMNMVNVTISMPEDATREEAVELADQALERIEKLPNAEYVGAMMGTGSVTGMVGGGGGSEYDVTVYVGLPEGDSGAEAGRWIADQCADMPCQVRYDSAMMDMSMLTGSGVTVNLYGEDMTDLQTAAKDVADVIAGVEGVDQVDDGLEQAQTAYHVTVDRNAAMKKGYTVAQLYMELATALTTSTTAMDMDMDSISADVIVETGGGVSLEELEDHAFTATDAQGNTSEFKLRDVAEVEPTVSLATINRLEQRRYLAVTASLAEGYNITRVTSAVAEAMEDAELPEGVTYEFAGENETIMDAVEDMMLMLAIGVVLVYFIMVAQFQSLKSPFIVMFTIPLAFTGGFAALLLFHMDISIVSLIGFVMLVGIIVNNGIVLVDYVNQLRANGMERREALVEAGVTRMRPIFMTSLTTILGLIVMALGKNVGTSLMQPVAVVCIGGLLYATIMTLFVVPAIYDMMNRKELVVIRDEDVEFNEM